jgi:hypothetical protein
MKRFYVFTNIFSYCVLITAQYFMNLINGIGFLYLLTEVIFLIEFIIIFLILYFIINFLLEKFSLGCRIIIFQCSLKVFIYHEILSPLCTYFNNWVRCHLMLSKWAHICILAIFYGWKYHLFIVGSWLYFITWNFCQGFT